MMLLYIRNIVVKGSAYAIWSGFHLRPWEALLLHVDTV